MNSPNTGAGGETEQLYEALAGEYDLDEKHYTFGAHSFSFLSVLDSYALLDRISPEEFVKDEQMPYWAEIWPSAITLSTFIADELPLEGKRIVEIGAGVGMASIVAAWKGASVLATDYSLEALRFIRYNALKNRVKVETERLDWRLVQCREQFDLLFAADVLYERVNLLPIVYAIDKLLKPGGAAFISDPRRRLAEQFLELAGENDFSVTPLVREYRTGTESVAVNIYRLMRSAESP
ncbi:methyltransferase domain-containing protein [Chlorobium sp. BLA1]|uniref:class I SAM-dependent methyltransferase n=1 Tax=Candidatus Chlorobium masyuteum TaxID=2716876 RepID=UPI001422FAD8|nr:methyltransferase domain-containing protein [Candidatus Chlorobium masyuteum]NHQ59129.1 methyltransferase domain-containing protein [Candidatus Chlorobium masyuteum]NTU44266.1 methyltransferase domain-containing protein [Chlorobiaceae bacterium]